MSLTRSPQSVVEDCPRWWKTKCQQCRRVKMMPFGTHVCPYCEDAPRRQVTLRRAYRLLSLPNLERVREAQGFTKSRLGAICGISRTTILNLENGRHQTRYSTARLLAAALGVSVEDLQREEIHDLNQ